ncbi:MAG TPA: translation initiation factor IF-3 [Firmicutes bacterium]|nr:translation initiation factor IF-3 [Bacillota bacterium]
MAKDLRVNEQIRAREVRLISENNEQLGIVSGREAIRMAAERGLDLVEVAPGATPPVCRFLDYGKFKYEQSKREKEARKKQKVTVVKEVKMRPTIDVHDFEIKARNAERFLKDGDKVKVSILFRGREIVHSELGKSNLERMAVRLQYVAVVERAPKVEGRNMVMVLSPKQVKE